MDDKNGVEIRFNFTSLIKSESELKFMFIYFLSFAYTLDIFI